MTNTETQEERIARIVEGYEADLISGAVFANAAASHRSVYGYQPPCERQAWAAMVASMAKFAIYDDQSAQLAAAILAGLPLYQSYHEMIGRAYDNAARAVVEGYTDVIRRASPNPGRPSETHGKYATHTLVRAAIALLGGCTRDNRMGWALEAAAEKYRITI